MKPLIFLLGIFSYCIQVYGSFVFTTPAKIPNSPNGPTNLKFVYNGEFAVAAWKNGNVMENSWFYPGEEFITTYAFTDFNSVSSFDLDMVGERAVAVAPILAGGTCSIATYTYSGGTFSVGTHNRAFAITAPNVAISMATQAETIAIFQADAAANPGKFSIIDNDARTLTAPADIAVNLGASSSNVANPCIVVDNTSAGVGIWKDQAGNIQTGRFNGTAWTAIDSVGDDGAFQTIDCFLGTEGNPEGIAVGLLPPNSGEYTFVVGGAEALSTVVEPTNGIFPTEDVTSIYYPVSNFVERISKSDGSSVIFASYDFTATSGTFSINDNGIGVVIGKTADNTLRFAVYDGEVGQFLASDVLTASEPIAGSERVIVANNGEAIAVWLQADGVYWAKSTVPLTPDEVEELEKESERASLQETIRQYTNAKFLRGRPL